MIDNNDSRYAFKWLKDNYLEIGKENVAVPANDENNESDE